MCILPLYTHKCSFPYLYFRSRQEVSHVLVSCFRAREKTRREDRDRQSENKAGDQADNGGDRQFEPPGLNIKWGCDLGALRVSFSVAVSLCCVYYVCPRVGMRCSLSFCLCLFFVCDCLLSVSLFLCLFFQLLSSWFCSFVCLYLNWRVDLCRAFFVFYLFCSVFEFKFASACHSLSDFLLFLFLFSLLRSFFRWLFLFFLFFLSFFLSINFSVCLSCLSLLYLISSVSFYFSLFLLIISRFAPLPFPSVPQFILITTLSVSRSPLFVLPFFYLTFSPFLLSSLLYLFPSLPFPLTFGAPFSILLLLYFPRIFFYYYLPLSTDVYLSTILVSFHSQDLLSSLTFITLYSYSPHIFHFPLAFMPLFPLYRFILISPFSVPVVSSYFHLPVLL